MYGAELVLWLALGGICAVVAWDVFFVLHEAAGVSGVIGAVIDFLSPLSFAVIIWYAVLFAAGGEVRLYVFLCMLAGAVLYALTARRLVLRVLYVIFENILKILGFIFKILLTPARFLYKMICVGLYAKNGALKAPGGGEDTDAEENRYISGADAQKGKEEYTSDYRNSSRCAGVCDDF